jgi:hypothetical protein
MENKLPVVRAERKVALNAIRSLSMSGLQDDTLVRSEIVMQLYNRLICTHNR